VLRTPLATREEGRCAARAFDRRPLFGHPNAEVLGRYSLMDVRIFRTDRDGAVTVSLAKQAVAIKGERQQRRRYWHDAPP